MVCFRQSMRSLQDQTTGASKRASSKSIPKCAALITAKWSNIQQSGHYGHLHTWSVVGRHPVLTVLYSRVIPRWSRPLAEQISDPGTISDAEWAIRTDLAACYRLFVKYGWTDLIFTHLSARVPGTSDQYLINPYGLLFEEVTASSLLKVSFAGDVITGDYPYNDAGHAIHSAILQARPDVNAVLHSHTRAGMTVSTMQCGLLPLTQQANEVMANVAYHAYDIAVGAEEECERLGSDIADKHAMIMHNHGLLTCAGTIAEAFYLMYTLENACKVQVDALASGQVLHYTKPSAQAALSAYGKVNPEKQSRSSRKAWPAMLRMLDANDPSYKN